MGRMLRGASIRAGVLLSTWRSHPLPLPRDSHLCHFHSNAISLGRLRGPNRPSQSRGRLECVRERSSVTETSPPPSPHATGPIWTDPSGGSELDIRHQIFCNRSLTMDSIKAVGFDMDYTLAQYKSETFESLAHEETKKKLVYLMGYPRAVLDFSFDHTYMMRGLVIDKRRGNVLKVDRHKYVKIAYHGFQSLSEDERQRIYGRSEVRDAFDEPDYTMIDTLFSISEAHLFMSLVETKENEPKLLMDKTFVDMYNDVRYAVDYCHRDGTLKKRVTEDPGMFIHEDAHLVPLFKMLRQSGKSIFLATNSLWDYTNVAMNYLLCNKKVELAKIIVVVVGAINIEGNLQCVM